MPVRKSMFSSPGRTILFSMIVTILLGTLLLSCPWAQKVPLTFLDCLFTATSATCVTGLLTVPMTSFTTAGHSIILGLIQIGALGLITMTVFFLSLFIKLGLTTDLITGELLEIGTSYRPRRIIFFTIIFTCIVECIGFIFILFTVKDIYPFSSAIFFSLFQAVSAFCNAGFMLPELETMQMMQSSWFLLINGTLVLVGGLGFVVWYEIVHYMTGSSGHKHVHLSLHTKLCLSVTAFLISFITCIIFMLEYLQQFLAHPSLHILITALFNGICHRSTGFSTLDFSSMHLATLFAIMIVAFIGSSPGSTGGGIKTTTFAVFLGAIRSTLSRRTSVEIKGRTIPNDQVFKAMAIFSVSLCWVAATIFILLLTEHGWRFIDIMSEVFAAFTNLGVSTGITPYLSLQGKLIIICSMLIGRVGSLTLLLAFKKQQAKAGFHYPEERILMS